MAISLKMSGKEVVNYNPTTDIATIKNTNIDSNVQFPAGHVLQMLHGYYDTPTTIGTTFTKIIELTGTAKGNNQRCVIVIAVDTAEPTTKGK